MQPELFLKEFPVLDLDSRITLRELSVEDAQEYYIFMNHPDVSKYLASEDIPTSIEHAKHELNYWIGLFRNKYSIYWGIVLKEDNRLIGTCGFNNWNFRHDRAEISYDINPDFWNQGIATKVSKKLTEFAFKEMNVIRVQATVEKSNYASMRVLAKSGYVKEGTLKQYAKLSTGQCDFHMFAAVRK
ncbi:MAG: GNAT family N-acetyltransferase [Alphaproteobacteria bacterium]|nr:GNAT family N-acetyltransferase [Alphaproteobacteria bacterium]OJV13481.1 MAG: hypothetical protein BGO27_04650 [Alphaproteobacteria bacterium 33-17]